MLLSGEADHILEPTFNVKGGIDEVIPSDLLAGSETSRLRSEVALEVATIAGAIEVLGTTPGVAPEVAASFARRRLRADGPIITGDDAAGREWRALRELARSGVCLELEFDRGSVFRPGGREHDVLTDGASWYKLTTVGCAGYWLSLADGQASLFPARPLQYLDRWAIHNRAFGDDVSVVAIADEGPWRQSIVIRQRHFAGKVPSQEDLSRCLRARGYRELDVRDPVGYGGKTFVSGEVCISDVRPANALFMEGDIVPIDFLVRRVRPDLVSRLQLRP